MQNKSRYQEESLFSVLLLAFIFWLAMCTPKSMLKLVAGIWILKKLYRSDYTNPNLLDNLSDILDLF